MAKRQVEVFTAGCPVCEPVVQLVQEMACPDCEVTIHDLRQSGAEKRPSTGSRPFRPWSSTAMWRRAARTAAPTARPWPPPASASGSRA